MHCGVIGYGKRPNRNEWAFGSRRYSALGGDHKSDNSFKPADNDRAPLSWGVVGSDESGCRTASPAARAPCNARAVINQVRERALAIAVVVSKQKGQLRTGQRPLAGVPSPNTKTEWKVAPNESRRSEPGLNDGSCC